MRRFDPRTSFGDEVSRRYDAEETRGDEDDTVRFLAGVAAGQDALELAVGTGRIALPLTAAGLRVDGIEQSQDMVDRMREKPGGDQVAVTMGDMSSAETGRTYGLVYLVYNTIGNLLSQDDQVRCFQNAARHLTDGGAFVLECRVPAAPMWPRHQCISAEQVEVDHVALDVSRYDPVTQVLDVNHVRVDADGVRFGPIRLRLASPPEFDLMARLAGLQLRERWGDWNAGPFTASSWRHVSVYERGARDMTTQRGSEAVTAPTPEAIHEQMADAFNRADVDAFVDLHEEGAITIPPHTGTAATGHAEIRASIEPIFAMRPTLTNEVVRKIERDGLALTLARWELSGKAPDGTPIEMSGEGTVVSRRQPEGGWRIVMESPSRPD